MASDKELMRGVARGDRSALGSIYDRYSTLLYSLAVRITGGSKNAEEILQDTFFQLWQKASQFDTARGSLVGWLLAITRHRALSRIRASRVGRSDPSWEDTAISSPNVGSSDLEQRVARKLVSAALSELPQEQQQAITLAYFDGLTCEEIATHTQTPSERTTRDLRSALQAITRTVSDHRLAPSPEVVEQAPATLETILITEELLSRSPRQRKAGEEADCMHALAEAVVASPESLIDSFLEIPLELCDAGTTGLSLLETNDAGEQIFRWTNLAGKLANCVGGTTPRNFSPCGVTLDRNCPQLFSYPGRYFEYFKQVEIPIVEGLVIPFRVGAKTEGTVWIVSHDEGSRFDFEDVRIMTSLTEFAGCALHLVRSLNVSPTDGERYPAST